NVIFGLADLPDAISITFARAAIMRFANEGLGMRFDSTHGQMLLSAIDVANLPGEQRVGAITIYLDFGMGVTIPDDPPPPDQIINVLRFEIDSRNFSINDVPVGTLDAAPFIEGDRTMVPLRVVGERMGATVGWIESTRTVTISGFGQSLQLPVDSPLPGGMGMPIIVADRTFVPLRYVSETLGAYVRWDAGARVVYVYL
ncbi:MAG: copper amine oxidase N-terminal domain-containing protein, partial [Defluviitaleaceae bacterium]|nr:copper amine oxidase N-terminal domain-containing protein [Defluviitaleaceae bacterium]